MQNHNVKVSVITPVYNGEKFLEETIRSVLNQTFTEFEYLLVNHASTDASRQILQKFQALDNRITIIELSINKGGPAYPRNEGIKAARGEYIAFVDADDVWKPHKLQTQLDFLDQHPQTDMVYSSADIMDESGHVFPKRKQRFLSGLSYFLSPKNAIFYGNFVNMNTVLMRRSALHNLFSEDKNLVAVEDWMFHIINFQGGIVAAKISNPLIYYRIHSMAMSNRTSDTSYRKIYYMLAVLFLESRIPFIHFFLANILNSVKLLRRKLSIVWSSH